jgi:hypothetical protein
LNQRESGDEQDRVARQERKHDEAGLREDDQEQEGIDPVPVLCREVRDRLVEGKQRVEQRRQHGVGFGVGPRGQR